MTADMILRSLVTRSLDDHDDRLGSVGRLLMNGMTSIHNRHNKSRC